MTREETLMERFKNIDIASLCDASKRVKAISSKIQPLKREVHVIGRALPVECQKGYLPVIEALKEIQPGDILVIDGHKEQKAVVGELIAAEAKRRGAVAIIVDGATRDYDGISALKFPVFTRYIHPQSCITDKSSKPKDNVSVGGAKITRGDWICADDDGIVVIKDKDVDEIFNTAEEIKAVEKKVLNNILNGSSLLDMLGFDDHLRDSHKH
ncbi:hypothetical protein KKA47_07380 [bacterium]|nr:hypothetical protein [bacterium]